MEFRKPSLRALIPLCAALLLAACGGGDSSSAPPAALPPPPPPPGTLIGSAGGTVTGPNGAQVVIPAGALATAVRINIEQITTGAPALPAGFAAHGPMFAFTPHGTTFAVPVTMTLPFDPAGVPAGTTPEFYKTTNAQTLWEEVGGATFGATSVSAPVSGFSDATVVIPPVAPAPPDKSVRSWSFLMLFGDDLEEGPALEDSQVGGDLWEIVEFGSAVFDVRLLDADGSELPSDNIANGLIGAKADLGYFAVGAEAPLGNAAIDDDAIGSKARLVQYQTYVKNAPNATFSMQLSTAMLQTVDGNGILGRPCPPHHDLAGTACDLIKAEIYLDVKAFTAGSGPITTFFRTAGGAEINGSGGAWLTSAWSESFSRTPLWVTEDFDFQTEDFHGPEGVINMSLERPPLHSIDLSSIEVGEKFTVQVVAHTYTYNRADGVVSGRGAEFETSSGAYLFNQSNLIGTTISTSDLTPVDTSQPLADPADVPVIPEPCIPGPGPNPDSGVIQFSAAKYTHPESGTTPTITVTRTGGSVGAVTATFTTSDGTAVAGADYRAVNSSVFFSAGDTTARAVAIPIIQDLIPSEPDQTVNLSLSQPGGCAGLGAQTTAVLTITDDDAPPAPTLFTVGGTVTGLGANRMVLENHRGLFLEVTANGPFTFSQLPTPTGSSYFVRVFNQPRNALGFQTQQCTVTNGTGVFGNANVTNVLVTCVDL